MKWFRMYSETLDDPKVQQLPDRLLRTWINLLCLCAEGGGKLPDKAHIAFRLRMRIDRAAEALEELRSVGLIDLTEKGLMPHNWAVRQFQSDNVSLRVQHFRNRRRGLFETLPETLHETASDTDTDTEKEKSQKRKPTGTLQQPPSEESEMRNFSLTNPPFDTLTRVRKKPEYPSELLDWFNVEFWPAYPKHVGKSAALLKAKAKAQTDAKRVEILAGLKAQLEDLNGREPQYIPHAATWLHQERWKDEIMHNPQQSQSQQIREIREKNRRLEAGIKT